VIGLNENQNTLTPKNRHGKAIRVLLIVFGILIIGGAVAFYSIYNIITGDNFRSLYLNPNKIIIGTSPSQTGSADSSSASAVLETVKYKGKTYARNPNIVNLLFLGIDYTEDRASMNLGTRSDMMLVCAVDTANGKVTLISIPRDTYAKIYHLNSKGKITKTDHNKLNTAYHFGDDYAAENAMACIQMFLQREDQKLGFTLDIPVYLYASLDIDGIGPVADSVGGVEVTLQDTIPGVGSEGEKVLLKGETAEIYIRDRHNTTGADIGRASKEQAFMVLLAKKIKDRGIVDNILSLYTSLQKYVKTNLSTIQMVDLAKILKTVNIDSIEMYTIPGSSQNDSPYYYKPDNEETLKLLLSVYYTELS
jgi:polyisoprenyl-teichoic acid--peptidoglycan teichoic acid transferase